MVCIDPSSEYHFDPETEVPFDVVIKALSSAEETSPIELDPPLYEAVEVDAINRLFRNHADDALQIRFSYNGHQVEIGGDGNVLVWHNHH